jgi:pimeloyl-ACP methyl ester carboxylesterase
MASSPPALVVKTSALVDIGGGELVWTRVYTAAHRAQQQPQQPQQPKGRRQPRASSPPPPPPALASLVAGAARRPPILLLHGFPDTGQLFDALAHDLARSSGHPAVVVPDLPGAGLSEDAMRAGATTPRDVASYEVGSLARRMLALMSLLQVGLAAAEQRFYVAGHDFGAAIAWRMAMAPTSRVARLVVLSVGHPAALPAGGARQRARFWYYLYLALSPADECEQALRRDDFALFRQVIAPPGASASSSSSSSSSSEAAAVDAYVARFSRSPLLLRAATNLYRANYRAASFGATRLPQSGAAEGGRPMVLGGGAAPSLEAALGIIGRCDPALTVEQMQASAAFVAAPATWSCEVWEDAGHWMMRDRPERLAETLRRFFCGVGGEAAPARARL